MKHSQLLIEDSAGDALLAAEVPVACKPPKNNGVVLLVDDEPAVLRLAERILVRAGYTVLGAKDGREAAAIAAERDDDIDLLITDVMMPYVSGPEVAALLLKKWSSLRVLLMSGYNEKAISDQGVLREGWQFLEKPFTPVQLASKVAEIISSATLVAA